MKEYDDKQFIAALNAVAATDDGKLVLAEIKNSCHWDQTYLASDNPEVSHFHAVKRGIYGGIRQLIKVKYLKEIEFNFIRKKNDTGTQPAIDKPIEPKRSDDARRPRANSSRIINRSSTKPRV